MEVLEQGTVPYGCSAGGRTKPQSANGTCISAERCRGEEGQAELPQVHLFL
jgi:hypothetical protein